MYTIIGVEERHTDPWTGERLWCGVRVFTQFRDVRQFCPRYAAAHGVELRVWQRSVATRAELEAEVALITEQYVFNQEIRSERAAEWAMQTYQERADDYHGFMAAAREPEGWYAR